MLVVRLQKFSAMLYDKSSVT